MRLFWLELFVAIIGLSGYNEVSSSPSSDYLDLDSGDNLRRSLVEKIVEKIKSSDEDVSRKIDSSVNAALERIQSLHESCKHPAQVKLEQVRRSLLVQLSDCSIYQHIQDQLNLVEADFDLTVKTIVGNAIGDIVHLGNCIESDEPLTCLSTIWLPLIAEDIASDIHISADTVFQILKLAYEGSHAVWDCLHGEQLDQNIFRIVAEAIKCNHFHS